MSGEALFLHAYPIVTANAVIQGRLDSFRNQYGFARNMAFALITSAIAILVARQLGDPFVHLRWALLASLTGIALFYRYLKVLSAIFLRAILAIRRVNPAGEQMSEWNGHGMRFVTSIFWMSDMGTAPLLSFRPSNSHRYQ